MMWHSTEGCETRMEFTIDMSVK